MLKRGAFGVVLARLAHRLNRTSPLTPRTAYLLLTTDVFGESPDWKCRISNHIQASRHYIFGTWVSHWSWTIGGQQSFGNLILLTLDARQIKFAERSEFCFPRSVAVTVGRGPYLNFGVRLHLLAIARIKDLFYPSVPMRILGCVHYYLSYALSHRAKYMHGI